MRYLTYSIILILVLTGSFLFLIRSPLFLSPVERIRPLKAALIDQVAVKEPDPYLVSNVTSTLNRVGYTIDYYGVDNTTVDLFRSLPSKGYGIIILREHSADLTGDVIALVTSEPFDSGKHVNEQLTGQVINTQVNNTDYFGITPTFVRESMQGTFPNTILIVMGCAGLANSEMAQAFVTRGAQVYISWDKIVRTNQSDGGAILLLQSMTTGHKVDEAVTWATENSPSNTVYSSPSRLEYYPLDQGELVLNLGM
jgi:hypothetical protein